MAGIAKTQLGQLCLQGGAASLSQASSCVAPTAVMRKFQTLPQGPSGSRACHRGVTLHQLAGCSLGEASPEVKLTGRSTARLAMVMGRKSMTPKLIMRTYEHVQEVSTHQPFWHANPSATRASCTHTNSHQFRTNACSGAGSSWQLEPAKAQASLQFQDCPCLTLPITKPAPKMPVLQSPVSPMPLVLTAMSASSPALRTSSSSVTLNTGSSQPHSR